MPFRRGKTSTQNYVIVDFYNVFRFFGLRLRARNCGLMSAEQVKAGRVDRERVGRERRPAEAPFFTTQYSIFSIPNKGVVFGSFRFGAACS